MLNTQVAVNAGRASNDWLSFQDIEREGNGYPKASTLSVWKSVNRHGFRNIVTMIGGKPRVRRDRWEGWLESRRLGGEAA